MKSLVIDGQFMNSKKSLYRHLEHVFSLPCYFGNNLDALWDILNEEKEETEIIFINTNQAHEKLGSYGEKLIQLLEKLSLDNSNYTLYLYK